jgi:hypothetical protein
MRSNWRSNACCKNRSGAREPVSERWHSLELNVVVFTRHAYPRSGERTYRLDNIEREEPSAELFKVPADYALRAAPDRK